MHVMHCVYFVFKCFVMLTSKQQFLQAFYKHLTSDIVKACDDLFLCTSRFDITSSDDKALLSVAKNCVLRPDIFANIVTLSRFLVVFIDKYPQTATLLDFNPKLSPAFLANLLTFNYVLNECEKNN